MAAQALATSARMVPTRAPSITRAIAAAGVRRERWRLTPAAEPRGVLGPGAPDASRAHAHASRQPTPASAGVSSGLRSGNETIRLLTILFQRG